jgi:hypothetical protein
MNVVRIIKQISDPFLFVIYNYVTIVSSQFYTVIKFVIDEAWMENFEK